MRYPLDRPSPFLQMDRYMEKHPAARALVRSFTR
jgi:hypothetical protein